MDNIPKPMRLMAAGACAGTVTKTSTAPLDRIKVLLQVQAMSPDEKVATKYNGIVGSVRQVLREEGFLALWRGNFANCARVVPVYASRFAFNDLIRDMVIEEGQDRTRLRPEQALFSGVLAGLAQQSLCYPFETVRTRLSLGGKATGLGQSYNGMLDCLIKTCRIEGIPAIYKGLSASCLYGGPYVGLNMSINDMMKRMLAGEQSTDSLGLGSKLLAGSVAATTAQTIVFPLDTLRRRLQANGEGGTQRLYSGLLDCIGKTYRSEGVRGFYLGCTANVVRMIPTGAIQHSAYNFFKDAFNCT